MSMRIGKKFSFDETYTAAKNPSRIYGKTVGDGRSGWERSHTGAHPNLGLRPKFRLDKNGSFFTIGSCFAREIEAALTSMDLDVITNRFKLPGEVHEIAGGGARNGALNAYTPGSMRELINMNARSDKMDCGFVQTGDNEWVDMMVNAIRPLNGDEKVLVRETILGAYDALATASVVFMTLGFTESWFDTADKLFVNRSPAGNRKTMRAKDRFEFTNFSANEAVAIVDQIIRDIGRLTNDKAKIIMTVSPVPLHGTWTDYDVLTANAYSKATLLSAAVSVASQYPHVDYYPSYEMVTMTAPDMAWEEDGVHVKRACVQQVLRTFADTYF